MVDEKALEIKKPEGIIRYQPEAEKLIQRGLEELQRRPSAVMERRLPFEPEMILIPAGEFLMGSDPSVDKDARDNEQPQHTLYLPDYYMARTPVTNTQYAAFVQATGHRQPKFWKGGKPPRGKEDHPAVYVSWYDAMAYCRWLAEVTGKPYCLPSEAEWEKGARGSDGRIYPWGNQWDAERCNSKEGGKGDTTPVGAYPEGASPYGLLDMAGNVWEWTRNLWSTSFKYPYDPADGREDLEAPSVILRVLRSGAFDDNKRLVRCAYRRGNILDNFPWRHGFRVVMSPAPPLGVERKEKPVVVKKPQSVRPSHHMPLHDTVPEAVPLSVMERSQPFEPEMILIPAGEFLMGSDPSLDQFVYENDPDDEQPQHTLYLPDYYLAKTPVTNVQYAAFVQATGHHQPKHWAGDRPPRGKEDHPVVNVSWYDAIAYCNWLSEVTGKSYCLPSEAEWEKGARGSDGRIYPWGNQWDAERCNSLESRKRDTTPVWAYPQGASPYGLLDMAGNVWEWTRSLWGASFEYPYDPADGREDLDATGGAPRVLRGGMFYLIGNWNHRCAARNARNPYDLLRVIGFRVVVVPGSPLE
jgi:formylglycine-generating enzyme required for sulfatase activity